MKALAQGYKRMLGMDDFAFYFVQLANWETLPTSATPVLASAAGMPTPGSSRPTRWCHLAHSGDGFGPRCAVESADMHPKDKLDVGERLALWALKNDYGRPIIAPAARS